MKPSAQRLTILALSTFMLPLHAAVLYWDGTSTNGNANGGDGTWNIVLTNWDSLATAGSDASWPSSGTDNDAVFGGTLGSVTIDTGGVTANDLTFSTTGYTIGGAGLTLNGTLPVINVTGTATINSSITSAVTGGFSKTGSGTLILGGSNTFAAGTTLAFGTTAATNLGAIRLAHSNALNGITLINGVPASGAATQARVELTGGIAVNSIEVRTGGRTAQQSTGAILVNISGDNTWGGPVRINGTGGGHGIRSDAGTLTISGAVNSMIGARTWEIGGAGNVTITGAVTTAVGITKFGAGTLTLSSSGNTYTGDTKVGAGSLVINHANALSGSALDLATADSGTVSFGPTITAATLGSLKGSRNLMLNNTAAIPAAVTLTVGANNTTNSYTGQLSGLGHLYKSGTGTQTLDPGSAASMSLGSISANGGSLILKSGTFANTAKDPQVSLAAYNIGAGARGGTLTIDGATLNVGAGNNLKIAATSAGSLSVLSGTVTSNDIVIGHNGAGIATQSGGTVTTTNLYHQDGGAGNSYTLTGGSLTARRIYNNTASTADFTLNLNGGTLYSAASTTNLIDSQNTGAQISVLLGEGNTFIDTTASSASIVRPMGNMPAAVGTFTKAGINTLTLTGANTYTGSTTINAGTLAVGSSGSLSDASAVVVKSTGTFDVSGITASEKVASLTGEAGSFLKLGSKTLEFGNASDTSYLGSIDSSTGGELTKTGAGKFTLAASSYTGTAPKINIALGTLLTGGASLPAATAITLSGGTLNTGTASNTVESLTVAEPSVIDFAGGGTPVLTFTNRGTWSGLLQIWNWTGTVMGSGTGGQLKFSDGDDGSQLTAAQVQFFSGNGTGVIGAGGVFLGTELVPVPEPTTLLSSSVLMGLIVFRRRRQPGSAQVA